MQARFKGQGVEGPDTAAQSLVTGGTRDCIPGYEEGIGFCGGEAGGVGWKRAGIGGGGGVCESGL